MSDFYLYAMSLILFAGWVFGARPWWYCLIPLATPLALEVFKAVFNGCKNAADEGRFWDDVQRSDKK